MPSVSMMADFKASAETRAKLRDPLTLLRSIDIEPHPWQAKMLASTAQQRILCCSRQAGKSTVTASAALHTAMTSADSDILFVAKAQRQAMNMLRTAMRMYRAMGKPVSATAENKQALELTNNSRIIALPGSSESIRSYSALRLLIIDEAAFVPDELYMSVRPMLAVGGGKLIVLSSAHGKRGWFYDAWVSKDAEWERYFVPASECPHLTPEILAREKRDMGAWWYAQEFDCEFLDPQSQLFATVDVEAALQVDVEQWSLPA